MGLASAMQQAQGGSAPQQQQQHMPPPPPQQQQHPAGPTPLAQAGWGAPPPQAGWGAPLPPAQQQQQPFAPAGGAYPAVPGLSGAPPQFTGFAPPLVPQQQQQQGFAGVVAAKLSRLVAANQLAAFYPPQRLAEVSERVARTVDFRALAARWRMPVELSLDLAALALYDVVIYADDSGSMEGEGGERLRDLELIMAKAAEVATLFDDDGIQVRFINSDRAGNNIKTASDAASLLRGLEYRYDTKLAAQMRAKVLAPLAYSRARLDKPLLVITITDGEPTDTPRDLVVQVIKEARQRLAAYGPKAVAFEFAQVGKDQRAQAFLGELDRHPEVGGSIDCTSYFELESAEYARRGVQLSPEMWLVKMMCGAIDPEYDEQDEAPPQQRQQYQAAPHAQQAAYAHCQQVARPHKKKGFLEKLFG